MRKELALLGLAILAFSLVGCTSVDEEISSTQGYTETTVSPGGTSGGTAATPVPAAATEMGITEEDLSVSDLDIELNDDGFSTELLI